MLVWDFSSGIYINGDCLPIVECAHDLGVRVTKDLSPLVQFNCRAANSLDFRGSFPNLRPILCVYEFLTKLPSSVHIDTF